MILRKCIEAYLFQSRGIWNHLPSSLRFLSPGRAYGRHLHGLVCRYHKRRQNHSTWFLRNRAELELMRQLLAQKALGSSLDISVLGCSKGAEVYSILWTIRTARPDLKVTLHAIDISQEILDFAKDGVYSLIRPEILATPETGEATPEAKLVQSTFRDQGPHQNVSIFQRMTESEMYAMFDREDNQARVKPWLKEGIIWHPGDACDPELVSILGPQDMVVANRFLCHMEPLAAERCLRNIARLVKSGGYLFVSGIDLEVRTRVAQEMGWNPVTDLIREIHEGDASSLRDAWPLEYWGLEPFSDDRPDWTIRYASVFQIGKSS